MIEDCVRRQVERLVAEFHPPLDAESMLRLKVLKPKEQLAILRVMRNLAQRRAERLRASLGAREH